MKTHLSLPYPNSRTPLSSPWRLRLTFLLLFLISSFFNAFSQTTKLWDKTLGGDYTDWIVATVSTPDGGYLVGGTSGSNVSGDKSEYRDGDDYWVVKIDGSGNKVWDKTFGGYGLDFLSSIIPTSDGGYLLGGSSNSGLGGDKTQPNRASDDIFGETSDFWVVKIDGNGNKVWDRTFGGVGDDGLSCMIAVSGGYLLGGTSKSNISGDKSEAGRGDEDYWILKIDANGNKIQDKTIGGDRSDVLSAIVATTDGGYLLGGTSSSNIGGDKSEATTGFWVVNIAGDGGKRWDKSFRTVYIDLLENMIATPDGGFLLGGYSTNYYYYKTWLVKIDSNGTKVWNKTYSDLHDRIKDIKPTPDGGYLVAINSGSVEIENKTSYRLIKIKEDGTKLWDKKFGGNSIDNVETIIATTDGNYLLGGSSSSGISGDKSEASRGDVDFWVLKIKVGKAPQNITFAPIADKVINTAPFPLSATASSGLPVNFSLVSGPATLNGNIITITGLGEVVVKASQAGDATYEAAPDVIRTFIVEDNTSAWNMRYGGSLSDRFTVVIKTPDGGYLSGGHSASAASGDKSQPSRGGYDFWIVKTDKNGTRQWDKTYGGSGHDYLNRIILTKDGGYLLAGSSTSGISGDKTTASRGSQDYWLIKISSTGVKQWDKTYGGSGFDDLRKVNQLANGDYLLAGQSNSPVSGEKSQASQGGLDYWILRINNTGTKLWDQRYGGTNNDYLESFTKTSDDGFLLAGSSASGLSGNKSQVSRGKKDYWLVKINSSGTQLWDKSFGGSQDDELFSVGITAGGDFFVAGHSSSGQNGDKSQPSRGSSDYWMLKISKDGQKLWDKSFGGSGQETLRSIIEATGGGFLLAGTSNSGISGDKSQASRGGHDYWLVKTDANGNKEYDQQLGGSGTEEFRYIQRTVDGGYLLGGRSDSGLSGDRTQPSQGGMDYWLVKITPGTPTNTSMVTARVDIPQEESALEKLTLTAYPNPAVSEVTVHFTVSETQPVTLKVYNNKSQEVATLFQAEAQQGKKYVKTWFPKQMAPGMYLLQLQTIDKVNTQKIIVTK